MYTFTFQYIYVYVLLANLTITLKTTTSKQKYTNCNKYLVKFVCINIQKCITNIIYIRVGIWLV